MALRATNDLGYFSKGQATFSQIPRLEHSLYGNVSMRYGVGFLPAPRLTKCLGESSEDSCVGVMPGVGNYADKSVNEWTDIDSIQASLVKENFRVVCFRFGWF